MKQGDLLNYFQEEMFIPELKETTKEGVLREMAEWLESSRKVYRASLIYDLLMKREELGSTGIGEGIAIPHCRTIAVEKMTVLFALASKPVEFNAADRQPVRMFFMVVAPPHDMNYLVFLGTLVEFITSRKNKKALLQLRTFEEFRNLVLGVMK